MKILFISFYNDEAYGLRILHSIAHNEGHEAKMLFFKLNYPRPRSSITEHERELFYDYLNYFKPDILAFSLVSSNFKLYQSFYKELRKRGDWKIIIGGWQATLNPHETIKYCDYLNIGEGEESIPELIECLENKRIPLDIKNIWFHYEDTYIEQKPRELCKDLNRYPIPIIDNRFAVYIDDNEIYYKDPYTINTRYGISISRGCPFSCTYCSNSTQKEIYSNWSKIRYRTIEHSIEELKQAKKRIPNLKCINFYDEVFPSKIEWLKEFFNQYKKEIDIPFYCMFYPGTCKEELIQIMKKAGLAGIWLGVQSGSERVRKEVFKRFYSNEKVLEQANLFAKYEISVKYDFIFDNPFETEKETKESIKLMAELPEPKAFNMFSLKFFPHTEITEKALKEKIISEEYLDDQLNIESPRYTVSDEKEQEYLNRIKTYESNLNNRRLCAPH